MWVDYKLYGKAEANYVNFQVKERYPTWGFFEFLVQFIEEHQTNKPPFGTINYHLNSDGTVHHIVYLSKRANKVVEALAGPYSHALLTAHFKATKDGKSIKTRD